MSERNSVNPTVRVAAATDAAAIAGVHVAAWRAAYRGLLPDHILDSLSVERRTREWEKRLGADDDAWQALVAERDGELVGFVTLAIPARDSDEAHDVGEIPALYVHPHTWGTGAGCALLDAAIERMRAAGRREAMLWMLGGNERAQAFYERAGWRDDGGRRASQYFPDVEELVEVRFRRAL